MTELKPCPICRSKATFKYGGEISNGMRLVKVACAIGCVEQAIYHMTEEQAAMPWNARSEQASRPQGEITAPIGWIPPEQHNTAMRRINEMRDDIRLLKKALEEITNWRFGYDGDCGVIAFAENALNAIK